MIKSLIQLLLNCLVLQISQMLGNETKFAGREPIGLRWDDSDSLHVFDFMSDEPVSASDVILI